MQAVYLFARIVATKFSPCEEFFKERNTIHFVLSHFPTRTILYFVNTASYILLHILKTTGTNFNNTRYHKYGVANFKKF